MSNHKHAIVGSDRKNKVSDIWRDFKKLTNKKIISTLNDNPEEIRMEWMLNRFEFARL